MSRPPWSLAGSLAVAALGACSSSSQPSPVGSSAAAQQMHSGPIAVSPDGADIFVVHPDADEVSIVASGSRSLRAEIALGTTPPAVDPETGHFYPQVMPRALAIDAKARALYVTGERSGLLYAIDVATASVRTSVSVCAEPIGVLVSRDDRTVFVACSADDEVLAVDAASLAVIGRVTTPRKPWALAWGAGGSLLATHLLGPGVSVLSTSPLSLTATWTLTAGPGQADPTEPHGQVRGIYDAVLRPGTGELWVAHLMLGTDTPQPSLIFDDTVFPAVSLLDGSGDALARLSVQANVGDGQAFGDVVSGPRALTFSADGRYAFIADTDSEDLLVVDAASQTEAALVRPLPGHLPEGVVVHGDEIYVQERNSETIVTLKLSEASDGGTVGVVVDGDPIPSLSVDPMPANLRLGQKLFFSADSDDVPLTQDHWVACASCHLEGRSDAVTWDFAQGPRDTPTNAGGTLDTGFLFRTADRTRVEDYWKTIDTEQGGHFAAGGVQQPLLTALAAYVNHALPAPVPPSLDATHTLQGAALANLRASGEAVFQRAGCASCHSGEAKTDSGTGNPGLDLLGPITLHDVGTCVTTGAWPDVVHSDIDGDPRGACAFDTPALRGLADSAPYLHDGSAATLEAVVPVMLAASAGAGQPPLTLSPADTEALVEYLRGL